jgi:NAD(P)-dependent dehydrogenase (short-subunit alcohol dehydrogenase family)
MDIRLDGRVALVTGGSRGLGLAMATEFAASGATVACLARDRDVLDRAVASVAGATGYQCDVRDAEALTAVHEQVVADLGPVDVLVNNAGTSAAGPFESITDEQWHDDLELKLLAAIRLIRLCLPAMKAQGWGRIINVLNVSAKAPGPRSCPTAVSRAAGMALTKSLATEMAPHGVLVNALNTGVLVTDQWHRLHEERAPELTFEAFLERTGRAVPLGRMGDPSEFANLACFLASDAASYLTGTSINVDGGMSPVV